MSITSSIIMKTALAPHRSLSVIVSLCTALMIGASPMRPVDAASSPAASRATLTDLRSVDDLKTLFNADIGKTRLVLLVSPT